MAPTKIPARATSAKNPKNSSSFISAGALLRSASYIPDVKIKVRINAETIMKARIERFSTPRTFV